MEIEKSDVKIGDIVELSNVHSHNSIVDGYLPKIVFHNSEIGNHIEILNIKLDSQNRLAYEVECKKGITYLRRKAFKIIEQPIAEPQDYSYLIPILTELNIN